MRAHAAKFETAIPETTSDGSNSAAWTRTFYTEVVTINRPHFAWNWCTDIPSTPLIAILAVLGGPEYSWNNL